MIYILHPTGGGPIKIGNSENPRHRRNGINSIFPYGVETLVTLEGGILGEKFLQRCFGPISCGVEWFNPCPSIWRFVIDAIDHGRPAFLPKEERIENDILSAMAVDMFGSPNQAIEALGYAPSSPLSQVFSSSSSSSYGVQTRVLFAKALKDRSLPDYIVELHEPCFAEAAE